MAIRLSQTDRPRFMASANSYDRALPRSEHSNLCRRGKSPFGDPLTDSRHDSFLFTFPHHAGRNQQQRARRCDCRHLWLTGQLLPERLCHRRPPPGRMSALQRMVARRRGRTEYLPDLQWVRSMPRHENVRRSCSLLLVTSWSAPSREALSQESVTNRSVHPQKLVTATLRDDARVKRETCRSGDSKKQGVKRCDLCESGITDQRIAHSQTRDSTRMTAMPRPNAATGCGVPRNRARAADIPAA